MSENIVWHETKVGRPDRERLLGQKGAVLWFTGLSGSGKSTLAALLEQELHRRGLLTYLLDGDNVRHGLNADLGFSAEDRRENNRRITEVSRLFLDAGLFVLVSFISPFKKEREEARSRIGPGFMEIFVDTPLEICESRDPKGLYRKARKGEIPEFTGISSPYEPPEKPDLWIRTASESREASLAALLGTLEERGLVEAPRPQAG